TLVLTILLAGSQGLGLTRMSSPYLLGTIFTRNRDRAQLVGVGVHMVNGWLFSLLYIMVFQARGHASWGEGALMGLVQAGFLLTVGMRILPSIHPHIAS